MNDDKSLMKQVTTVIASCLAALTEVAGDAKIDQLRRFAGRAVAVVSLMKRVKMFFRRVQGLCPDHRDVHAQAGYGAHAGTVFQEYFQLPV